MAKLTASQNQCVSQIMTALQGQIYLYGDAGNEMRRNVERIMGTKNGAVILTALQNALSRAQSDSVQLNSQMTASRQRIESLVRDNQRLTDDRAREQREHSARNQEVADLLAILSQTTQALTKKSIHGRGY